MSKRKPYGYWKNFENVRVELEKITHELGHFPSSTDLRKNNYSGLSSAILRHQRGYEKLREKLEIKELATPRNRWKDINYVIAEAKKATKYLGFSQLPSSDTLRKAKYGRIVCAVNRYHGRMSLFRQTLGEQPLQQETGKWRSIDFVLTEAKKIIDVHGSTAFESQKKLRELGHGDLLHAIYRYHGSLNEFRTLLTLPIERVPQGSWKKIEFCIQYAKRILEENKFERLPGSTKLQTLGYNSFSIAVSKYHGGFPAFRELLANRNGIPSAHENLEAVLEEYTGDSNE